MGYYDDEPQVQSTPLYLLRVDKGWFRGKDVFTDRLYIYERELINQPQVSMPINAGNMIYVMMRRLELDFEKQDALINSYRDLMYKLSYVNVVWYDTDRVALHFEGEKSDVMWAITFITQVFPDVPLVCEDITQVMADSRQQPVPFELQNGSYVGENRREALRKNDILPNIWDNKTVQRKQEVNENQTTVSYDSYYEPQPNELFAISDGRVANYVRMDERFVIAENYGESMDAMLRHHISASCIKDFEDLIHSQMNIEYELYRMRYVALMNKVHELEKLIGGLEVSCYDALPIGERGLPYASPQTLERTNRMEQGSLKYYLDKLKRNKAHLTDKERKQMLTDVGHSVLYRIDGYDIEYQTYMISGSTAELCADIRMNVICDLYADFAEIDAMGILMFPKSVYRALCNDPENPSYQMSAFERQRLQTFGRGYLDFLSWQIDHTNSNRKKAMYQKALSRLEKRYLQVS